MAISLTVVTPEGQAFHGEAEAVVLPGSEGEFGVLPGHEAFLSALRIGPRSPPTPSTCTSWPRPRSACTAWRIAPRC